MRFFFVKGFGIILGPSRIVLDRFWTKTEKSNKRQKVALVRADSDSDSGSDAGSESESESEPES